MQKLVINKMENAYGIKKLRINIDDKKELFQELIYSRNGTFKTSFAKALNEINNGNYENIIDRLTNEKSNINIYISKEDETIKDLNNKFIIFSRDIYENNNKLIENYNNEIEKLTIDKKDSEYINELLTEETLEIRLEIDNYLKGTGQNFESILDMYTNSKDGYLDRVISLLDNISKYERDNISEINIKTIFQKPYDMIESAEFKEKINNYIEVLKSKTNSDLFDNGFNEMNCMTFASSVDKSKFLSETKKRGISVNGEIYYDIDKIKNLLQKEIDKISSDPKVIEESKELTKSIGISKEAESLKVSIQNNPLLVTQLSIGRKGILFSYLKNSNIDFEHWLSIVIKAKEELSKLLELAVTKKTRFENAIEIYKNRFHPCFDIKVIDKEETMLGLKVPTITFYHHRNPEYEVSETVLNNILSSGEKTTLNILKFIVEYEANKSNDIFVVLDDIVETFDYSNRYAFIEYINDLVKNEIPVIVLTHNFEFFRSLGKRIDGLRKSVAISNEKGEVDIQKNNNIKRNIENILMCNNKQEFYMAIPYLREAKTILHQTTDCLDSCLHYTSKSSKIKIQEVLSCFPEDCVKKIQVDSNELYLDGFKRVVSNISSLDDYDIVKKTILSIACRITIESKIINEDFDLIKDVNVNQTAYILDNYGNKLNDDVRSCLEDVQLTTPEFLHGNSFMYEPLIDIRGDYLMELYNRITKLNKDEIWK